MKQTCVMIALLVGLISGTLQAGDNRALLVAGAAGALGSYVHAWWSGDDIAGKVRALEEAVHGKPQENGKAPEDQPSILARLADLEKYVNGNDVNSPSLETRFGLLTKDLHTLIGIVQGAPQGESEAQGGKSQEDQPSMLARLAELEKVVFPAHDENGQDISLFGRVKVQLTTLEGLMAKLGHGVASGSKSQPENEKGKQSEDFDPLVAQGEAKIEALDSQCKELKAGHSTLLADYKILKDAFHELESKISSHRFSNPFKKKEKKAGQVSSGSESKESEAHMTFEHMESLVKEHEHTITQLIARIAALEGQCQAPKDDPNDVADDKSKQEVIPLPFVGQTVAVSAPSKKRKSEALLAVIGVGKSNEKNEALPSDDSKTEKK